MAFAAGIANLWPALCNGWGRRGCRKLPSDAFHCIGGRRQARGAASDLSGEGACMIIHRIEALSNVGHAAPTNGPAALGPV